MWTCADVQNVLTLAPDANGVLPNVTYAIVITEAYNVDVDKNSSVVYVTVVPQEANTIEPDPPVPPQPEPSPYYNPFVTYTSPIVVTLAAPDGLCTWQLAGGRVFCIALCVS